MRVRTKRGLAVGLLVVATAGALSAALLLKAPGPWPVSAGVDADVTAAALDRLEAAAGAPRGEVRVTDGPGVFPGIAQSFQWNGGRAGIDSSGKFVMVQQDPSTPWEAGGEATPALSSVELDRTADDVASLFGWSQAQRRDSGLKPGASRLVSQGTTEYWKTWNGYTSQGIANSARLEIKLDARDGRLVSLWYHPGTGDTKVDAGSAIPQEKAVQIALDTVRAYVTEQAQAYSADKRAEHADYSIDVTTATLKLTDAPGVTGGETKLIWFVELEGSSVAQDPVGGFVYVDALSGEVILYMPPA